MAEHLIADDAIGLHEITLTANVVDTIRWKRNVTSARLFSNGTAKVYYTLDGSEPTVGGTNCYVLPDAVSIYEDLELGRTVDIIKVVSSGTPVLHVTKIPK